MELSGKSTTKLLVAISTTEILLHFSLATFSAARAEQLYK